MSRAPLMEVIDVHLWDDDSASITLSVPDYAVPIFSDPVELQRMVTMHIEAGDTQLKVVMEAYQKAKDDEHARFAAIEEQVAKDIAEGKYG